MTSDRVGAPSGSGAIVDQCIICQCAIDDQGDREVLPCAHKFHLTCLEEYGATAGKSYLDLPCGMCKLVPSILLSQPLSPGAVENLMEQETQEIECDTDDDIEEMRSRIGLSENEHGELVSELDMDNDTLAS